MSQTQQKGKVQVFYTAAHIKLTRIQSPISVPDIIPTGTAESLRSSTAKANRATLLNFKYHRFIFLFELTTRMGYISLKISITKLTHQSIPWTDRCQWHNRRTCTLRKDMIDIFHFNSNAVALSHASRKLLANVTALRCVDWPRQRSFDDDVNLRLRPSSFLSEIWLLHFSVWFLKSNWHECNPCWGPDPNWFMIRPNRAHIRVFPDWNYRVWTEVRAHYGLDDGLEMVWLE